MVSVRLRARGWVRLWVRYMSMSKRCQTPSPAQNEQKPGSKYPV